MKLTSIISTVLGAFAALLIFQIFYGLVTGGFSDGRGMAILLFGAWAFLACALGFVLSFVVYVIAKRRTVNMPTLGQAALVLNATLLSIIGVAMVFG